MKHAVSKTKTARTIIAGTLALLAAAAAVPGPAAAETLGVVSGSLSFDWEYFPTNGGIAAHYTVWVRPNVAASTPVPGGNYANAWLVGNPGTNNGCFIEPLEVYCENSGPAKMQVYYYDSWVNPGTNYCKTVQAYLSNFAYGTIATDGPRTSCINLL